MKRLCGCLHVRVLYLPLFLVLCALFACEPLRTYEDFWAHAAVGRWIWQEQEIPRHTLFLWTAEQPWVAHSWLGGVAMFGLAELSDGGDNHWVILGFRMVMAALPFVVLWFLWQRRAGMSSMMLVAFGFAVVASRYRFQTRPELFTSLFFALLLSFLVCWPRPPGQAGLSRGDRWAMAGILAMFILWVNCHGAVVIGLVVLGATVACDLVQDKFDRRARILAGLGLASLLAVQVNPYGVYYWQVLQPVGGEMFSYIAEWQPFWSKFDGEVALAHAILLAIALLAWGLNPARRWAHLAWLMLMSYFFLTALRNSWLLAQASLAVIAANAQVIAPDVLWRRLSSTPGGTTAEATPTPPPTLRWLVRLGLVAWMGLNIHARLDDVEQMDLPLSTGLREGGLRFLQEHPLPGKMLNDYDNSAYLQWCLGGTPPLFIDVLNAYPDRIFMDLHMDISLANRRGRRLLDEYGIGYVILSTVRTGPNLAPLADFLDGKNGESPDWVRVYAGFDSVIWVRRRPEYRDVVRNHSQIKHKNSFANLELWGRY